MSRVAVRTDFTQDVSVRAVNKLPGWKIVDEEVI
jgi:hypothetical protein